MAECLDSNAASDICQSETLFINTAWRSGFEWWKTSSWLGCLTLTVVRKQCTCEEIIIMIRLQFSPELEGIVSTGETMLLITRIGGNCLHGRDKVGQDQNRRKSSTQAETRLLRTKSRSTTLVWRGHTKSANSQPGHGGTMHHTTPNGRDEE